MSNLKVVEKITELTAPIISEEGCELVDAEIVSERGRQILRLFIDKKPDGVQLADCSRVSHAVEDLLEVEEVLSGKYHLEVSSPGLNRPLRLKKHFEDVLNQCVNVVTKQKIEGRRNYKGILRQVTADQLIIEIDHQEFTVPLAELAKANLVYESKKEQK